MTCRNYERPGHVTICVECQSNEKVARGASLPAKPFTAEEARERARMYLRHAGEFAKYAKERSSWRATAELHRRMAATYNLYADLHDANPMPMVADENDDPKEASS